MYFNDILIFFYLIFLWFILITVKRHRAKKSEDEQAVSVSEEQVARVQEKKKYTKNEIQGKHILI